MWLSFCLTETVLCCSTFFLPCQHKWSFLVQIILSVGNSIVKQITVPFFKHQISYQIATVKKKKYLADKYHLRRDERILIWQFLKKSVSVNHKKTSMTWFKQMSATCCWVFQAVVLWCSMSWLQILLNHITQRVSHISSHSWNQGGIFWVFIFLMYKYFFSKRNYEDSSKMIYFWKQSV